jgi:7-cyano-7-deazaguanine synthase
MSEKNQFACLALSGGMDSASLLLHLLARNYEVIAVSFLYGQKHDVEVECAKDLTKYLIHQGHKVSHHLITLDGLESLLFSALIKNGHDVPEGNYSLANMKETVVPNRNKIFISILQSIALSIAIKEKQKTLVAMGIHAGDHAVYPDCREEFIRSDYQAYLDGNWDAEQVINYLPYLSTDKLGILQDGLRSCEALKLDFDQIYKRTLTSYKPDSRGVSDYKSASSRQRISAFMAMNRIDPVTYADETGVVDWQTVTDYVKNIDQTLNV